MPSPISPLQLQLEATLFVANEPLSAARLAELSNSDESTVIHALQALTTSLQGRGWRLCELHGRYQLISAPEAEAIVRRYLETETRTELSKAALETLAIIAYRGPITRSQLDDIRGVASDTMLRSLLQRGLIVEASRAKEPGRPMQYHVSPAFLQHFGLESLAALPPLPQAETTS